MVLTTYKYTKLSCHQHLLVSITDNVLYLTVLITLVIYNMTKNNPWPWNVSTDESDLSQGASCFQGLMQSRGLGGETQESISNGQPQVILCSQQVFVPQKLAEA